MKRRSPSRPFGLSRGPSQPGQVIPCRIQPTARRPRGDQGIRDPEADADVWLAEQHVAVARGRAR